MLPERSVVLLRISPLFVKVPSTTAVKAPVPTTSVPLLIMLR